MLALLVKPDSVTNTLQTTPFLHRPAILWWQWIMPASSYQDKANMVEKKKSSEVA